MGLMDCHNSVPVGKKEKSTLDYIGPATTSNLSKFNPITFFTLTPTSHLQNLKFILHL